MVGGECQELFHLIAIIWYRLSFGNGNRNSHAHIHTHATRTQVGGGGALGVEAPPPIFYHAQARKLVEAVVQVQLHFTYIYGQ